MLLSFKAENVYSIGNEQVFDFYAKKREDNSVADTRFGYINKINCVVGNNGAGKTSMLKALTFFVWLAEESFYKSKIDDLIPYEPHYLYKNKPSKMEMVFSKKDKLFKLEFTFDEEYVLQEKLSIRKVNDIKYKRVYSCSRKDDSFITLYSEFLSPINRKERERVKNKRNSSLFSYFLNTGALSHLGLNNIFPSFYSNLTEAGRTDVPLLYDCFGISEMLFNNKKYKDTIVGTLKTFDIGINDISEDSKSKFVLHDKDNKNVIDKEVVYFVHGNDKKSFNVPLPFESDGTIRSLSLLFPMMEVLTTGGLLVIDEIEMSKHPIVIKKIISSFEYSSSQKEDVQILFSTHQSLLLEDRSKSQIFLVEKTDCINSEIYRLDEVEGVRNDENFAQKYLSGRYGAVPRKEVEFG